MQKDTIVQFMCFETSKKFDEFVTLWEHFSKNFKSEKVKTNLLEQTITKNRFKYVSQHQWPQDEFQFVFMKEKQAIRFPESHIKVVQAGGYSPIQVECKNNDAPEAIKILLFLDKTVYDIEAYKKLTTYHYLNIYEAYYESCKYSYILEFFVNESNAAELLEQLKTEPKHFELGMYKECLVLEG